MEVWLQALHLVGTRASTQQGHGALQTATDRKANEVTYYPFLPEAARTRTDTHARTCLCYRGAELACSPSPGKQTERHRRLPAGRPFRHGASPKETGAANVNAPLAAR